MTWGDRGIGIVVGIVTWGNRGIGIVGGIVTWGDHGVGIGMFDGTLGCSFKLLFAWASRIIWSCSGSSSELDCDMVSKELTVLFVTFCSSSSEMMMVCGLLLTVVVCPSVCSLVCPSVCPLVCSLVCLSVCSSVDPLLIVVCSGLKISSNLIMCRFADCK